MTDPRPAAPSPPVPPSRETDGGANSYTPPLPRADSGDPPATTYDVFISYSKADETFAKILAEAIRAFRPPDDLGLPNRPLSAFRYPDDFTGVAYKKAIRGHLRQSDSLIVICSPDAAASHYVNDEIRDFVEMDPAARPDLVIPILFRGLPNNEVAPGQEALKAFPPALVDLHGLPIAANYLGFDTERDKPDTGVYADGWFMLLANICHVSRAAIEDRYRRHAAGIRRRQRRVTSAIVAVLLAAVGITSLSRWQAVQERKQKEREATKAVGAAKRADSAAKIADSARNDAVDAKHATELALNRSNVALAASLWHQLNHAEPDNVSFDELTALWTLRQASEPVREAFLANATQDADQIVLLGRRPVPLLHAAFSYWGQERRDRIRATLFRALANEKDASRFAALVKALVAVPGALPVEATQRAIDRALNGLLTARTTAITPYASALATIAQRVPPDGVRMAFTSIIAAIGRPRTAPGLNQVVAALEALAPRMSPGDAKTEIVSLLEAVERSTDGGPVSRDEARTITGIISKLQVASLGDDQARTAVRLVAEMVSRKGGVTGSLLEQLLSKLTVEQKSRAFDEILRQTMALEGAHIGPQMGELADVLSGMGLRVSETASRGLIDTLLADIDNDQDTFDRRLDRDVPRDPDDNDYRNVSPALLSLIPRSQVWPAVGMLMHALSDAREQREIEAIASGIQSLADDLDPSQRLTLLRSVFDAFSKQGDDPPPLNAFISPAIAPMVTLTIEQARSLGLSLFDGIADRAPLSERLHVVNWATEVVINDRPPSADDQAVDWLPEANTSLEVFAKGLSANDMSEAIGKLSAAAAREPNAVRKLLLGRLAADLSGKPVDPRLIRASLDRLIAEATKSVRGWELDETAAKSVKDFTPEQRMSLTSILVSWLEQAATPGTTVYESELRRVGDGLKVLLLASSQSEARPVVERMVRDLSTVSDPLRLKELARTLDALARTPISANIVDDVLSRVLERLSVESDAVRGASLQSAVRVLAARLDPATATRARLTARTLLAWSAGGLTSDAAAVTLAAALPRTSSTALVETVVEYLNFPSAVEKASDVLLDAVAHAVPGAPDKALGTDAFFEWVARDYPHVDIQRAPTCPRPQITGLACPAR